MILKSITLNGFKSFAKKTTIDVSHNVTGIVGPNGSGKSNIAEAIRFVVGEQSMKTIRSKSLSDLVFKGSSGASALSRASVSIHIDNRVKTFDESLNEDLASFLAYDEIILTREVYLDGGSSYKINNTEVRLKDVQSLLGLAGIGASAHTIISQGEADKILLSNAKERKEMLDDALGIRIHRIRLRDSEKKLEKVKTHLSTVDLIRKQ
jgi:chromosome segregation protein